ncbi:MAG: manganese efflux pump MntP family protein [Thermovirgaceae bacterium]
MDLATAALLGFSLSMDAFAVSIAISFCVAALSLPRVLKVAGSFGLFQAIMPLFGWLAASGFAEVIKPWDHWVAFLLLSAVGIHMILEGAKNDTSCPEWPDPTTGKALFALSVGTSIDAFAAGVGFVGMGIHVSGTVAVIGVMTFGLSAAGMVFGHRIGRNFGERMLVIGGILLVALGLKIVVEHLFIMGA